MPSHRNDESQRRTHILTRASPAIGRSIADAFVIKDGDVFLVADDGGDVPEEGPHGFGLYYHDCRFLDAYVLRIGDETPIPLVSTSSAGFKGVFELTNPDLADAGGGPLEKHNLALRWDRVVEGARRALHDVISVHNFAPREVVVSLSLSFRSEFDDVATVRGLLPKQPGTLHPPRWEKHCLCLRYDGRDRIRRTTDVHLWRPPDQTSGGTARFALRIAPETEQRRIALLHPPRRDAPARRGAPPVDGGASRISKTQVDRSPPRRRAPPRRRHDADRERRRSPRSRPAAGARGPGDAAQLAGDPHLLLRGRPLVRRALRPGRPPRGPPEPGLRARDRRGHPPPPGPLPGAGRRSHARRGARQDPPRDARRRARPPRRDPAHPLLRERGRDTALPDPPGPARRLDRAARPGRGAAAQRERCPGLDRRARPVALDRLRGVPPRGPPEGWPTRGGRTPATPS